MDPNQKQEVQQMIDDALKDATAFSKKKLGDTPTDNDQLVPKGYCDTHGASSIFGAKGDLLVGQATSVFGRLPVGADATVLTADSTQALGIKWGTVPPTNIFGNGADSVAVFDGTASVAGASKSASAYTLTRDVYFTNATFSASATLDTNGYQVFGNGVLTIGSGSYMGRTGITGAPGNFSGGGGVGGTGGGGGSVLSGHTVPGGKAGTNGTQGGSGNSPGNGGTATTALIGASANPSIGVTGSDGGYGGTGGVADAFTGGSGGGAGQAGSVIGALNNPDSLFGSFIHSDITATVTQHQGSAASGGASGGGGGAGAVSTNPGGGGGGGGSGSDGGIVAVFFKNIINNATGGIRAIGGPGGAGANGSNGTSGGGAAGGGGGGGGGTGGTGGVIILVYSSLTQNGTFDVSGGAAGNPGNGGSFSGNATAGGVGTAGNTGATGKIWQYQV